MSTNNTAKTSEPAHVPDVVIRRAQFPQDTLAAQELLRQYASSLAETIQEIIREEGYFEEVANVATVWECTEEKVFIIAFDTWSGAPVGCAALRPLKVGSEPTVAQIIKAADEPPSGHNFCELKRFFTTPMVRGNGVGRMLLRFIAETGRDLNYHEVRRDTSENLVAAIKVYKSIGFERYARDGNPLHPETIFYKLDLGRMEVT